MADYKSIAGRIKSEAFDGVSVEAQEILDISKNKKQSQINAETDTTLANHASAIQGLNSQNYETYTATDQTTVETDVLPAEGSEDTIYRLGNWDGTQYDVTCYSEYSWNGSAYVHISTKTQIGEVFDISAYHASGGTLAKYADLAAALDSNNGGGVPASLQKGGMSVKFVHTYDNKYVQYRLLTQTFSTTVSDWQGVDEELITGSKNLVESGCVEKAIRNTLPKEVIEDGLYICDQNGNAIIRLDVLDNTSGFGAHLTAIINGLIAAGTADISSSVDAIEEMVDAIGGSFSVKNTTDGNNNFYLCNEDGEVLVGFIDGKWKCYIEKKGGFLRRTGNLDVDNVWVLGNNSVKNDKMLVFSGDITSFTSITLGHGHGSDYLDYGLSNAQWLASRVVIDTTNITVYNQAGSETSNVYAHGLTIKDNIQVEIVKGDSGKAKIRIVSCGESFQQEANWDGSQGDIFIKSNAILTDCVLSWTCNKLLGGVWVIGDSYFSLTAPDRWTYYLIQDGFVNNVLNGWSGAGSTIQLQYLINLLTIATPDTIIWCVGMNNPDDGVVNPQWNSAYEVVKTICTNNEINLILSTIPTVRGGQVPDTQIYNTRYHTYKNAIVRASGYRYIDFDKAVGANSLTGEWYDGMLSSDGVHPTVKGAKALYQRAICDAPELMK